MSQEHRVRVVVNGYGVIGKRVADAITLQGDNGAGRRGRRDVRPPHGDGPQFDREDFRRDHRSSSNSLRSLTTVSAPWLRKAAACPTRSTPTTHPNEPARPASTPAIASSNTAQ